MKSKLLSYADASPADPASEKRASSRPARRASSAAGGASESRHDSVESMERGFRFQARMDRGGPSPRGRPRVWQPGGPTWSGFTGPSRTNMT